MINHKILFDEVEEKGKTVRTSGWLDTQTRFFKVNIYVYTFQGLTLESLVSEISCPQHNGWFSGGWTRVNRTPKEWFL